MVEYYFKCLCNKCIGKSSIKLKNRPTNYESLRLNKCGVITCTENK